MSGRQPMIALVSGFIGMLVEVEGGLRPMRHLRPFMAPRLQGHAVLSPSAGSVRRVGRVLVQQRGDRCEAVAILHERSGRASAVALALVRDRTGWMVTDIGRPGQPVDSSPGHATAVLPMATWQVAGRSTTHLTAVPPEGPAWRMPAGWVAARSTPAPRQPTPAARRGRRSQAA